MQKLSNITGQNTSVLICCISIKQKNSPLIKLFFFSELELQKARLETKKESIVKGRSQKKKELALTKRSLSELDGFSTKLEKLKR